MALILIEVLAVRFRKFKGARPGNANPNLHQKTEIRKQKTAP
jgi:hypothetical protein